MSTLDEELAGRRASKERVRSFTLAKTETRTLVLSLWQSDQWILPWAQFISARLAQNRSGHDLELSFATVRVLVTGENLRELMEPLASFRVSGLCDLPPQYGMNGEKGEPYISLLEVRLGPSALEYEKRLIESGNSAIRRSAGDRPLILGTAPRVQNVGCTHFFDPGNYRRSASECENGIA